MTSMTLPWRWVLSCIFKMTVQQEQPPPEEEAEEEKSTDPRGSLVYSKAEVLASNHEENLSMSMHEWMAHEDQRREKLFSELRLTRRPRRSSCPGASPSFQMAWNACTQVYCCGACGAWVARPQDVVPDSERVSDASLDDSAITLCVSRASVRDARSRDIDAVSGWTYNACDVRCERCDVFLGIRLRSVRRKPSLFAARYSSQQSEAAQLHDMQGASVSVPRPVWWERRWQERASGGTEALGDEPSGSSSVGSTSREDEYDEYDEYDGGVEDDDGSADDDEPHSEDGSPRTMPSTLVVRTSPEPPPDAVVPTAEVPVGEMGVGHVLFGVRYLRLADAHSDRPLDARIPLLCRGCDKTLSYTDQLLCTHRRWGFGRSVPQPACFINSLVAAHVRVGEPYDEQLAQGPMVMADVWCACGKQVGYRFCGDRTPGRRNLNQVGRYGLVWSTFKVANYQLPGAKG